LRGKIVIADENKTIGGSINLSPSNFDLRRELAIEIKSKRVLKRFVQVSRRDGKQSRRLRPWSWLNNAGGKAAPYLQRDRGTDRVCRPRLPNLAYPTGARNLT
jgi:phosphatidylserine/phosphatidylglycerophosphate/cardiolipin synthase-like enzyme